MALKQKIISGLVTATFIVTMFSTASGTGVQNNEDGVPFANYQLGEWVAKANGQYEFHYSKAPFKNLNAPDKGLIPYAKSEYANPSTWAKSEVLEASKMGLNNMSIITGYQGNITRKEFASTIIQAYYKYFKIGDTPIPNPIELDIFPDVSVKDETDEDMAILHAYYLGITNGRTNGKFDPSAEITREEQATMLYRFIQLFDNQINVSANMLNYFADYKDVSPYAKAPVAALGNREIFLGYPRPIGSDIGKDFYSNTDFRPKTYTTREQALCLILRICKTWLDDQITDIIGLPQQLRIENETKLVWNPVYGATYYDVIGYKFLSDTETDKAISKRTNTINYELKGLESGVYDFSIQPFNEFNAGLESQRLRVVVPHPVEKESIVITDNTNGTANLAWDNVAHFNVAGGNDTVGATKYQVVIKEKGTNKVLEDKIINEADGETTSMTLNEPLVDDIGSFTVTIYAYNEGFASAPVTAEYTVSEETVQEASGVFNQVAKMHSITTATTSNVPVGEYPIYSLNGTDDHAYKYNNNYYRINDDNLMTIPQNISNLVEVKINGTEIMNDVKKLVITQI
jgi:hypothetical protein